jgi:hypothetical protein
VINAFAFYYLAFTSSLSIGLIEMMEKEIQNRHAAVHNPEMR